MQNPHVNPLPPVDWQFVLTMFTECIATELPFPSQVNLLGVCNGIAFTVRPNVGTEVSLNLPRLHRLAQRGVQCESVRLCAEFPHVLRTDNALAQQHRGTLRLTFDVDPCLQKVVDAATITNFVQWVLVQQMMFPQVRLLDLKRVRMPADMDFRPLPLRVLRVNACTADPDFQIHACVNAPWLQAISLAESWLVLTHLSVFKRLAWLDLQGYRHWPEGGGLQWLMPLRRTVQTLILKRCAGLQTLEGLHRFEKLESLDVRDNFQKEDVADLAGSIEAMLQCRVAHNQLRNIRMQGCGCYPLRYYLDQKLPGNTLFHMDRAFPPDPKHLPPCDVVDRVLDLLQQDFYLYNKIS